MNTRTHLKRAFSEARLDRATPHLFRALESRDADAATAADAMRYVVTRWLPSMVLHARTLEQKGRPDLRSQTYDTLTNGAAMCGPMIEAMRAPELWEPWREMVGRAADAKDSVLKSAMQIAKMLDERKRN